MIWKLFYHLGSGLRAVRRFENPWGSNNLMHLEGKCFASIRIEINLGEGQSTPLPPVLTDGPWVLEISIKMLRIFRNLFPAICIY
jgi:hypothetical protein